MTIYVLLLFSFGSSFHFLIFNQFADYFIKLLIRFIKNEYFFLHNFLFVCSLWIHKFFVFFFFQIFIKFCLTSIALRLNCFCLSFLFLSSPAFRISKTKTVGVIDSMYANRLTIESNRIAITGRVFKNKFTNSIYKMHFKVNKRFKFDCFGSISHTFQFSNQPN